MTYIATGVTLSIAHLGSVFSWKLLLQYTTWLGRMAAVDLPTSERELARNRVTQPCGRSTVSQCIALANLRSPRVTEVDLFSLPPGHLFPSWNWEWSGVEWQWYDLIAEGDRPSVRPSQGELHIWSPHFFHYNVSCLAHIDSTNRMEGTCPKSW